VVGLVATWDSAAARFDSVDKDARRGANLGSTISVIGINCCSQREQLGIP
jgi:hypothetical protein